MPPKRWCGYSLSRSLKPKRKSRLTGGIIELRIQSSLKVGYRCLFIWVPAAAWSACRVLDYRTVARQSVPRLRRRSGGSGAVQRLEEGEQMREQEYEADVVIVGLGGAGACAAIAAHDAGAEVIVVEKQPKEHHYPNTRISGGGFHSPDPSGDPQALKEYVKAMFSGENLAQSLEGEQPEFSDELAEVWANLSPENEDFMRSLDPDFKTFKLSNAAFPDFPGARDAGYAVVRSTYTGRSDEASRIRNTRDAQKDEKEAGEAFYTCLRTGIASRDIRVDFATRAQSLIVDEDGAVTGVRASGDSGETTYVARRAVILTCGGYEYNKRMRKAFLEGPGGEGWAFYGSTENTGDGIEMALKVGAGIAKAGKVAGRIICAIPERRHGLKIGLNTSAVGKPNEIVVDNYGRRFASERRITKDPSRYIFYKEVLPFDTISLLYPRIPSWMVFDEELRCKGPVVRLAAAAYAGVTWGDDNLEAIEKGWVLKGETLEELARKINEHPDNKGLMDSKTLKQTVETYNDHCMSGHDPDFNRDPDTLGPVATPPFYAIPLYPGGPNTKGGLRADGKRRVLDWQDRPIARLYAAGEIASAFQFVYQGGGNLAECITFGRAAGRAAAALHPWKESV
ncbi:FAD-dependent oxidoreductase [Pseudochelatococcus sp. B33]